MFNENLPYRFLQAIFALIHVYWIGLVYTIKEWFFDYFSRKNRKLMEKNFPEQKFSTEWDDLKKQVTHQTHAKEVVKGGQKVAVLTGADGCIGIKLVEFLISVNYFVIAIGLKRPEIHDDQNLLFFQCDLLNLGEVAKTAAKIGEEFPQISILICNAGVMLFNEEGGRVVPIEPSNTINDHGDVKFEPHLTINCLAHVMLFERIRKSMENSKSPRAVFVSSSACHAGNLFGFLNRKIKDQIWAPAEPKWLQNINGYKKYADSKLLLSLYTLCLSNKLKQSDSKIKAVSVHPGIVAGNLYRNTPLPVKIFINVCLAPFLRERENAAVQILRLCFLADLELTNGAYYENDMPIDILTEKQVSGEHLKILMENLEEIIQKY